MFSNAFFSLHFTGYQLQRSLGKGHAPGSIRDEDFDAGRLGLSDNIHSIHTKVKTVEKTRHSRDSSDQHGEYDHLEDTYEDGVQGGDASDDDEELNYDNEGEDVYDAGEENEDSNGGSLGGGVDDAFAQGVMQERKKWELRRRQQEQQTIDTDGEDIDDEDINDASLGERVGGKGLSRKERRVQKPDHIPVVTVLVMTVVMASAAGLGALPFFFVKQLSSYWTAIATSSACGVMFAASFDLIHEGQPYGAHLVVFGIFLGGLFIQFMQSWLDGMENIHFGHLHGSRARRMVLMVGIMAAHAVGEGCGVGVSFCGDRGWTQGVLTTLAIGVHNVPEGLAKATVLVSQGASASEALFWSILTCLPQPLVAVPSFMFVDTFEMLLPTALGFAAGCMIWMVFAELLPDALKGAKSSAVASTATLSAAALEGIRMGFESLEGPSGSFTSFGEDTWVTVLPTVVKLVPAVVVAATVAGTAAASPLPTPLIISFTAVLLGLCSGVAPFVHQVVAVSSVPLLHSLSAAVAGVAAAVLLRRSILRSLSTNNNSNKNSGGKGGYRASVLPTSNGEVEYSENNTNNYNYNNTVNNNVYSSSLMQTNGGGSGGMYSNGDGVTHHRRVDTSFLPESSTTNYRNGIGGGGGGGGGAFPSDGYRSNVKSRRLTAPTQAAALTLLAAGLLHMIPLGWHFARESLLLKDAAAGGLPVAIAMSVVLAVQGAAAGGAVRGVISGRSFSGGASVGCIVSCAMGAVMVVSRLDGTRSGSSGSTLAFIERLSYPQGWTETLTAAASGAVCLAALLQVAVAMSTSLKHARLGIVLAVVCFGVGWGVVGVGCFAASGDGTFFCIVKELFLQ